MRILASIPKGRKAKKRNLEKLEGWGKRSSLLKEEKVQEVAETQPVQKWDWKEVTDFLKVTMGTSIKDWNEKGKHESRIIPEGRIYIFFLNTTTTNIKEKERKIEQEGAGGDEEET